MPKSSSYDNVQTGKLQLKGSALPDKKSKKKRKKKDKKKHIQSNQKELELIKQQLTELEEESIEDTRTEAERKFDQINEKREEDKLKKEAELTHREKIDKYNRYLSNLSEHHDIPRVGPG